MTDDAFAELVDDLTSKHYALLSEKLQGGNRELAESIDDAISHELDAAFWYELVTDAAHSTRDAMIGHRFRKLVEKALLAQAEVLAIKDAERAEKNAEDERAAYQFEMARLFPSFVGAPM